jgi:hypothetical protein
MRKCYLKKEGVKQNLKKRKQNKTTTMATTMRDANEFLRRADVAQTYKDGTAPRTHFVAVSGSLSDPSQQFFLYNVAHAHTTIRSPDGKAWMRPLGFFPSKAATQTHANLILKYDPGLELRYFPAAAFFCIGRSKYKDIYENVVELGADGLPIKLANGDLKTRLERTFFDKKTRDTEIKKVGRLIKRHAKTRKEQLREVKTNALWRRMGDADESLAQMLAADTEPNAADDDSAKATAKRTLDDEETAALLRAGFQATLPSAPAASVAAVDESKPMQNPSQKQEQEQTQAKDQDEMPLLEHATLAEPEPEPLRAVFGSVKPIPRKLELRHQRFVVIAVIDDYITLDTHEHAVNAWCALRDAAFKVAREALLWRVLESHGRLRKSHPTSDAASLPLAFARVNALDKAQPQDETAVATAFTEAQDAALRAGCSAQDAKIAGNFAASNAGGRATAVATIAEMQSSAMTLEDVIPPLHKLVRKWLVKNPPPTGFNVWGEYIGKDAATSLNGLGFVKLRREEVLHKLATFMPPRASAASAAADSAASSVEAQAEQPLVAPAIAARDLKVWLHQRDMRIDEQTWRWAGHHELPARKDVLRDWYTKPENARPDLEALPQEEVAVAGYRAFDSEADAQKWVKSVEKVIDVKDHDLSAITMYDWVRLDDRNSDSIQRNYRNTHVHDIMASKKEQSARARELELEARLTKRKLNVVTVTDNAVQATQELPSGLSAAEFDAASAATAKAEAETKRELDAEASAALTGQTYESSKLTKFMLAGETKEINGGSSAPDRKKSRAIAPKKRNVPVDVDALVVMDIATFKAAE